MPNNDKIYIVIPVYNGWEQTRICLESLKESSYKNIEILVVDHGSTDTTKENLPVEFPNVTRIFGEPTLWWAGASNLGIRTALRLGAKFIMLLNNDCYVTPETIKILEEQFSTLGREAIIAPSQKSLRTGKVLSRLATTCFLLGFPTLLLPNRRLTRNNTQGLHRTKLILGGRGVLIPASIFERIGQLDEKTFPHYGADHDFYLRCVKQKIPLFVSTRAFVYVDDTKTTLASNLDKLSFREFIATFSDRRSHRNLTDLTALFKRYYPIKGLHHLGVTLNLIRYTLLYVWKRVTSFWGSRPAS